MTLNEIAVQEILLSFIGLGFIVGYENPKKAVAVIMGIRLVVYLLAVVRI